MRYIILILITMHCFTVKAQKDTTVYFMVSGVCDLCKDRIEKAAKIGGVKKAEWSLSTHLIQVTFNPQSVTELRIQSKIAASGHDTPLKKAKTEVYQGLPECCRYKDGTISEIEQVEGDSLSVRGIVLMQNVMGDFNPLQGATITDIRSGNGVVTDEHGRFVFAPNDDFLQLVISYTGYISDTISVQPGDEVKVVLNSKNTMTAVVVTARKKNITFNIKDPLGIRRISQGELQKAACCNLSESFETNPSVDMQYNDAVTGSKQIQLLGLAGIYTQLTLENLPGPRGLSTPLGLNTIAGPWIESIQLSKGTGSVVNGFESIAGQINIELLKAAPKDFYFVNAYVNSQLKSDFNLHVGKRLNNKWATVLLLHDDFIYTKVDMNNDGYRDQPTGNLFSLFNRWEYSHKGISAELGFKLLSDNKIGGEVGFESAMKQTMQYYGAGIINQRWEGFLKMGYIFPGKEYKSIGLQLSAFTHTTDAYFGVMPYDGKQNNVYGNLIYQNILGNSSHKFRTGISYLSDAYREQFNYTNYGRTERIGGSFFEYLYGADKISLVAGVRADYHNLFGWFFTPKLNFRWSPFENTAVRLNFGRGQRSANVFAENMGSFASARSVVIKNPVNSIGYGLLPEVAWNKGISIDQKLKLFMRDASISFDFFRNDFVNQIVADAETPGLLQFYNLTGKSYSNSLQLEFNCIPLENFETRLAYRWFEVFTTYGNTLREKPFNARSRAFINAAYNPGRWKFDATYSYTGSKRIPNTKGYLPERSPAYGLMNAQVSHTFGKKKQLDIYLGGENLFNALQRTAILAADRPFSSDFDASMIWGPLNGRMVYGGLRFILK